MHVEAVAYGAFLKYQANRPPQAYIRRPSLHIHSSRKKHNTKGHNVARREKSSIHILAL
jgi:hypothetical protein